MLDKFVGTDFTVEYKYDGERAQVHVMEDGRVAIYRRASCGRAMTAVEDLVLSPVKQGLLLVPANGGGGPFCEAAGFHPSTALCFTPCQPRHVHKSYWRRLLTPFLPYVDMSSC